MMEEKGRQRLINVFHKCAVRSELKNFFCASNGQLKAAVLENTLCLESIHRLMQLCEKLYSLEKLRYGEKWFCIRLMDACRKQCNETDVAFPAFKKRCDRKLSSKTISSVGRYEYMRFRYVGWNTKQFQQKRFYIVSRYVSYPLLIVVTRFLG